MSDWELFNNNLPASTFSTRLVPNYREGRLYNGTNRSVYAVEFYEPSQPQAQISVSKESSFCTRDTLYFFDYSAHSDIDATWSWSFPGGVPSSSTERDPKVVYPVPGTYSVTLTVTDQYGSDTQTKTDFITVTGECDPETVPGNAMNLNGVADDYLVADPLDITTNTMTISAWIKPTGSQNGWAGLVFSRGGSTGAVGLNYGPDNELRYHWNGSGSWGWNSGQVVPQNQWSHVALVITPTDATIYLNGEPASQSHNHEAKTFDAALYLGADPNFSDRRFNGLMDEVVIWDRSLSQNEIREVMHLTKVPAEDPNLLLYYQFNRMDGVVTDRSGIKHGTMNGGAARFTSTAPVGSGESKRMEVTAAGTYDFAPTNLQMVFPTGAAYPDGELVVTRLDLHPDQLPDPFPASPAYWIVHNYGANSVFTEIGKHLV